MVKTIEIQDVLITPRRRDSHKGDYGKVYVIGGCENYIGAPYFCALSALKSGAGVVTLVVPRVFLPYYADKATCGYTLDYLPDEGKHAVFDEEKAASVAAKADVIAIGCGMGNNAETRKYVEYFLRNYTRVLVVDADGINAVSAAPQALEDAKCKVILTPHVGEFKRLLPGWNGKPEQAEAFAKGYNVVLAVKSAVTYITDGTETYSNSTGTPAMAKGGSGDVLCGMVAAFAAVYPPLEAAKRACYFAGKAGEAAAQKAGNELSLTPLDLIEAQAQVFGEYSKKE